MTTLNTVDNHQLNSKMIALLEKFNSVEHYANGLRIFAQKQEVFEPIWTAYVEMLEHGKLDRELKELIRAKIAENNECSPYAEKRKKIKPPILLKEITETMKGKLDEVGSYETSTIFSCREKLAIKFAEKLGVEPESLDDKFFFELRKEFTDPEIVELGHVSAVGIGFERFLAVWTPRICDISP